MEQNVNDITRNANNAAGGIPRPVAPTGAAPRTANQGAPAPAPRPVAPARTVAPEGGTPRPVAPAPAPAPAPVRTTASTPAPATTQTQASTPVRMSQGDTYEGGNTTPVSTSSDNSSDAGDNSGNKPKLNIKAIGIGIGVALVFILIIAVLGKLGKQPSNNNQVELPSEEIPIYEEPIYEAPTNYNDQEIIKLRACGYSLEEMENAFLCGISCDDMIAQAEAERQAWIDEAVAPYFDTTSDEYKSDMAQTWKGLTKYEDTIKYVGESQYLSKTRNLDYEKVDVHGSQLFIKIYLQEESTAEYFFHLCTLDEWSRLPDKGNVITTYNYTTGYYTDEYGNYVEDTDRIFITSSTIEIFD